MSWSNLICRKSWVITELPGTLKESLKVKVAQSCPTLCDRMDCVHGIHQAKILEWAAFPFSRGSFPTQGWNPGLSHCRWILYQLSHQGSPRILEWVAYALSSGSFWLRNQTGTSCTAGRFFTNWAIREAHFITLTQLFPEAWLWTLERLNLSNIFPQKGFRHHY